MKKTLKLITEHFENVRLVEAESSKDLYIEGVYSSAELKNHNGRKYKKCTLEREVNSLQSKLKESLFGELNHPTYPEINLERAAILIETLHWDSKNDNDLLGRAVVLETPMGQIAKAILKKGKIGISSRGLGAVNEDGYVDDESYQLLTWDLVSSPSNIPSWVKGIYEAKEWSVSDAGILVETQTMTDNEKATARTDAVSEMSVVLTPELIHILAEDNDLTLNDAKKIYTNVIKDYIKGIADRI